MSNDTSYYIELAISFIIIFILLYIAIHVRKSTITVDNYYKMKKQSIEDLVQERISYDRELEQVKATNAEEHIAYVTKYNKQTEKILSTVDELKGIKTMQSKNNNTGGDANDN